MMDKYGLYINGKWIDTEDTLEVLDKYSQKPFAKVSKASENDVDLAISSALEAFETKKIYLHMIGIKSCKRVQNYCSQIRRI